MELITEIIKNYFKNIISEIAPDFSEWDKLFIQRASSEKFGDFQTNFAMVSAKFFKKSPRDIANMILETTISHPAIEKLEIAGPGFINIFINRDFLGDYIKENLKTSYDFSFLEKKGDVIIDYSSPNIAKPMHIGHLRSTVIGDSLKRIYRFLGYNAIGDNHLGDWGTQFGKLIVGYRMWLDKEHYEKEPIAELERIYVKFENEASKDETLLEKARAELKKLQDGDEENRKLWQEFIDVSLKEYNKLYERMGISFDTYYGESFYHDMMEDIVKLLLEKGIAKEDEGALVVFFDENENLYPAIVRKKDGAFLYATSDLACIKFRKEKYDVNRIIYVTDERQQTHFKQVFKIAEMLGWNLPLVHVPFGLMRFADGVFSTRKGNVIKLVDLLDEAVLRAYDIVNEKNPSLADEEKKEIAEKVGIGAVKYADLSQNRITNVIFDWDKMLSFEGNTAPYLQYTYARIQSLKRKAEDMSKKIDENAKIYINNDTEKSLAIAITQFPNSVLKAAEGYKPNLIADYIFDLAQKYNTFYNSLQILKEDDKILYSRLLLSHIAGETIKSGLNLLGIDVVNRM